MRTIDQIRVNIRAIFRKHNVYGGGLGFEGFMESVDEVHAISVEDSQTLKELHTEWKQANEAV